MKQEAQKLAANLKRLRLAAGLTQVDVAEKTGMERVAIYRLESAKSNPTLSTLSKLAKVLGVTIDDLVK